jgi:phage/plasmid-associated DNA primase
MNKNYQNEESKIVNEFVNFMKKHKHQKDGNDEITHTLMGPLHCTKAPFKGSYSIPDKHYDKFLKLYRKAIDHMDMYVVERPKEVSITIVDIDFKTSKKHNERQYLDEHIESIIEKYNKFFIEHLRVDKNLVKAHVFEKPTPTYEEKKKEYKDGFHITYPDLPMSVKKRYFFFDLVKKEIMEEDTFQDIPFVNTYEEILDTSVLKNNGCLMYGSHKEGREAYSLTKIYNHDMSIDTDNYDDYEMISNLSQRKNCDDEDIDFIDDDNNEIAFEVLESYVNTSVKKKVKQKKDYDDGKDDVYDDDNNNNNNDELDEKYLSVKAKEDIEMAKKLVTVLSNKRADVFEDWIRVGWTLNNISPTLLEVFKTFSKRSKKYERGCCEKIWKNHPDRDGFSIASLHWWARSDNTEEYLNVIREKMDKFLRKMESGTHDDIANIVKDMYAHMYKCVNIGKNIWYEYQGSSWVQVDSAYTLKQRISNEVTQNFMSILTQQCNNDKESIDQDQGVKSFRNGIKTCDNLKTTGFVKNVVEQCSHKFYDKKFEEKLNNYPNLLGFDNGVYDLKNGCFRKGIPDDMVSMSVGYNYKKFKITDKEVQTVVKYFNEVQTEEDMREYVLRLISSFLSGRVKDQKFVLWTGSGCHAKDELIKMFDGSLKKIQDIKTGENLLGGDGRKRRVVVVYRGQDIMYDINIPKNNDKFTVNEHHRLALRSHFRAEINESVDLFGEQIYVTKHHEISDDIPIEIHSEFYDIDEAKKHLKNVENKEDYIEYGDTIPCKIADLLYVSDDMIKNYKIPKYNCTIDDDFEFTMTKLEGIHDFYGVEVDGDKKYVIENDYVTYNSNGKSTTIDLIHNTLGDYSDTLPVTVITKKRGSSSSASPELADKFGKRFMDIYEPEQDDTVYVGQMKGLTAGNDRIYARPLYGDPFTYKPQFKLILVCNKLPYIPSNDGGTWRRLRVTPFESEFVHKPTKKNQFLRDDELCEKMEKWGPPFIWLLLNVYYPRYVKYGLEEPKKVTQYTDAYKKDSDVYCEFLADFVEEGDKEKDGEKIDFLYNMFKNWYRGAYSEKVPPRKELVSYLKGRGYVVERNYVKGIKLIEEDE